MMQRHEALAGTRVFRIHGGGEKILRSLIPLGQIRCEHGNLPERFQGNRPLIDPTELKLRVSA
jgi:hypothetical protein